MVRLEIGGAVVDTPGEREFGLWNAEAAHASELALLFPEMRRWLAAAVSAGLPPRRRAWLRHPQGGDGWEDQPTPLSELYAPAGRAEDAMNDEYFESSSKPADQSQVEG